MAKYSFANLSKKLRLLSNNDIDDIYTAALELLDKKGVKYHNSEALRILSSGGGDVDEKSMVAKLSEQLIKESVMRAPSEVSLYDRNGELVIELKESNVIFNPGSAAINILDMESGEIKKPTTEDFIEFVRLTDALKNIRAQSTALVVSDVPEAIKDRYRLYIVLKNSIKPIITGAFTIDGLHDMKKMLGIVLGEEELVKKPIAIFDVCPTPPLKWSELISQNLIDCSKYMIPAEILPMPLAGALSPATLAGTLVQHTAEALSGIVLAQLTNPGAPLIYGGSPTIFEMRYATTPMGAIESVMIQCCYSEIGKYLGLPTHAYLGLSDSKTLDAQAGLESGIGMIMGTLAGINVISGPGMLDFESCQSFEKLIIDNEICGQALRLSRGIEVSNDTLAIDIIKAVAHDGHFLKEKHTLDWFEKEQYIPSLVLDRNRRSHKSYDPKDICQRANIHAKKLLAEHKPEPLDPDIEKKLDYFMKDIMDLKK
ncbi:MAG: trimethylamine methyltransferase family protein [Candidatus Methylarchaceae archaeon HK02M2]|nr:trimethylamine methyltransferase family protein [Candidatus Methylarchaceae archaeon HK02M2]